MRLNGKVAIITGGGSGIGKAIAQAFVREGAKVVIVGRDVIKLERATQEIGPACIAVAADVSKAPYLPRVVNAAIEKFKSIHILVNNAAVLLPGTAESLSEKDFDQTFNINVRGSWLMSRAVLPYMRASRRRIDRQYCLGVEHGGSAEPRGLFGVKRRGDGHDEGDGAGPCRGKYSRQLHRAGDRCDRDGSQVQHRRKRAQAACRDASHGPLRPA